MRRKSLTMTARALVAAADLGDPKKPRTFRLIANTGEPMRIFPWDKPVVVDLDTIDVSGLPVPALYDHCTWGVNHIVGLVEAAALDGGEFVATGKFTPTDDPDDYARRVLAKADAGHVWQVSIGGDPKSVEEIQAGNSVVVNGRTYAGPISVARGTVLREISFVVLGGDRRTSAVVSRHRRRKASNKPAKVKGSAMSFEDWLLSMGFDDPSAITEIQRANLQQMYDGDAAADDVTAADDTTDDAAADDVTAADDTTADDTTDDPPLPTNAGGKKPVLTAAQAAAEATRAERRRAEEVGRLCREHGNPVVTSKGKRVTLLTVALRAGWDVPRLKSKLLDMKRTARPTGPNVIVRSHDKTCTLQAMQGATILRFGGKLDSKAYQSVQAAAMGVPAWLRAGINDAARNQIMEAAQKFSDMSAVDLCREACRLDGKDPGHGRKATIQAAFSGGSLTNIFTTNVNVLLLATYIEAPDTTVGWTKESEVADFKTNERPRMTKGPNLSKLPRGGEADHMTRSDVGESFKIARYAGQFQVDEQDIIDDSLGALGDMPVEMGLASARLRPDLVYAILLANPTLAATARALFNATDGNLLTTAALASATLKAAIKTMLIFRENGVNLNLSPTHLLVPPTIKHTAAELINSATIFKSTGTNATVEFGSSNSLMDENLQLVSDARMENGVVDPASGTTYSGSTSTWWLACAIAQTIEVAYRRGTGRSPQVRPFTLDKGKYGVGWDVAMDIGAKALDWRGFVENTA